MKQFITGLTIPQQYICLPFEQCEQPLSIFLTTRKNNQFWNVTSHHLFLGYKPLIMAIVVQKNYVEIMMEEKVCLNFIHDEPQPGISWKGFSSFKNCQARLLLKKTAHRNLAGQEIIFYEGCYGEHYFLNPFHQFINGQREKWKRYQANNLSLHGNLYDQVRIAYSYPRMIALVTVCVGDKMNMFPTDLHGPCGNDTYLGSLRVGGKANDQIESTGKAIVALMPVSDYKEVYARGKNHMKNMMDITQFAVSIQRSTVLKMPLPLSTLMYYELDRFDSIDAGIHRIHFYKCLNKEKIRDGNTLAHIHQYYAQWRVNHNLGVNMFLR